MLMIGSLSRADCGGLLTRELLDKQWKIRNSGEPETESKPFR
jgi:hypothetical protein